MTSPVLDRALEIVEVRTIEDILEAGQGLAVFTPGEWEFAFTKSDPARRLAARYAAKRAAARLLGVIDSLVEIEVVRSPGRPPHIELHGEARERLAARGGGRPIVSLTHSRRHAAALVLLLPDEPA